jgi:uncharacterized GH25 family protein
MKLFVTGLLSLLLVGAARAHNIWIIPSAQGDSAAVVWSDDPEPDNKDEPLTTIASAKAFLRRADGGVEDLTWKQDRDVYHVACPGKGVRTLAVTWKAPLGPAYTLVIFNASAYLPDHTQTAEQDRKAAPWDRLQLQIVPRPDLGVNTYQTLFRGKPLANQTVRAYSPPEPLTGEMRSRKTNKDGLFTFAPTRPGVYGFRTLHRTDEAVEHNGVKYAKSWYEGTLTFRVPEEVKK